MFRQSAVGYIALLQKMTHTDKASYGSLPPATYPCGKMCVCFNGKLCLCVICVHFICVHVTCTCHMHVYTSYGSELGDLQRHTDTLQLLTCHVCLRHGTARHASSNIRTLCRRRRSDLNLITNVKISTKFSLYSPYISNTFSRESPSFHTSFQVCKRSPLHSKDLTIKSLDLEIQIFQNWSPPWVDASTTSVIHLTWHICHMPLYVSDLNDTCFMSQSSDTYVLCLWYIWHYTYVICFRSQILRYKWDMFLCTHEHYVSDSYGVTHMSYVSDLRYSDTYETCFFVYTSTVSVIHRTLNTYVIRLCMSQISITYFLCLCG